MVSNGQVLTYFVYRMINPQCMCRRLRYFLCVCVYECVTSLYTAKGVYIQLHRCMSTGFMLKSEDVQLNRILSTTASFESQNTFHIFGSLAFTRTVHTHTCALTRCPCDNNPARITQQRYSIDTNRSICRKSCTLANCSEMAWSFTFRERLTSISSSCSELVHVCSFTFLLVF